jgi:monoterpene epsilon-lactone hydrolase
MASASSRWLRWFIRRSKIMVGGKGSANIREVRAATAALVRLAPRPRGVAVRTVSAGGVPGEWLVPKGAPGDRALLYIHGGGFVFCSTDTHRLLAAQIARAAATPALSINYRLAPENPFPAGLEDCWTAYHWLIRRGIAPERIAVAGDSAGGNLALALLLALKAAGDPLPGAAAALSPVTDLTFSGKTIRTKSAVDPVFPGLSALPVARGILRDYVRDNDPRNPLLSPLFGDLHGLPPLLLHAGADEVLLDDSVRMVQRVRATGGSATLVTWEQMWHVFQSWPFLPEARRSTRQIGEFVDRVLGGLPPAGAGSGFRRPMPSPVIG